MAYCQPFLKISCKTFGSFCEKLLTDKQTNNDENVSSLAKVMRGLSLIEGLLAQLGRSGSQTPPHAQNRQRLTSRGVREMRINVIEMQPSAIKITQRGRII